MAVGPDAKFFENEADKFLAPCISYSSILFMFFARFRQKFPETLEEHWVIQRKNVLKQFILRSVTPQDIFQSIKPGVRK